MSLGDNDDDELFSSLARELLADLRVDDTDAGWLSLDQLERELAQLDAAGSRLPAAAAAPAAPLSAASLVLSGGAPDAGPPPYAAPVATPAGLDAWSMSLQRFTASALEEDFLSADAARRTAASTVSAAPPPPPPGIDLSAAQEYNVAERPQRLAPPPGIPADPSQLLLSQAADKLVQELQGAAQEAAPRAVAALRSPETAQRPPADGAPPHSFPKTPQNSMSVETLVAPAPTPPPSAQPTPAVVRKIHDAVPGPSAPVPPVMAVPVAVPVPAPRMPAWQRPPFSPPPQRPGPPLAPPMPAGPPPRIFCNPHPRAPPVPAQALASKYMTARDISYVVYALMKPLLAAGLDLEADYHLQLLRRAGQPAQPLNNYKNRGDIIQELASRRKKSQEWSSEKQALGHVAKTNVLRPRALIAPFLASAAADGDGTSTGKQRAALWRARIYCDQAYQAYARVVECWRAAPPGQVPPGVQLPLERLLKCFGMANATTEVDPAALALLLKLRKGRVLVARVLEQALVPPRAAQALLPVLLETLTVQPPPAEDAASDDRLFRALARVVTTLPDLSEAALVDAARRVVRNGAPALASESRMHCVHALLQRGSALDSEDWSEVEADFMTLLGGM